MKLPSAWKNHGSEIKSDEPTGELMSRPILPPDASHTPEDNSAAGCPEARQITGEEKKGAAEGGEESCSAGARLRKT